MGAKQSRRRELGNYRGLWEIMSDYRTGRRTGPVTPYPGGAAGEARDRAAREGRWAPFNHEAFRAELLPRIERFAAHLRAADGGAPPDEGALRDRDEALALIDAVYFGPETPDRSAAERFFGGEALPGGYAPPPLTPASSMPFARKVFEIVVRMRTTRRRLAADTEFLELAATAAARAIEPLVEPALEELERMRNQWALPFFRMTLADPKGPYITLRRWVIPLADVCRERGKPWGDAARTAKRAGRDPGLLLLLAHLKDVYEAVDELASRRIRLITLPWYGTLTCPAFFWSPKLMELLFPLAMLYFPLRNAFAPELEWRHAVFGPPRAAEDVMGAFALHDMEDPEETCDRCRKPAPESGPLRRCARCRVTLYCGPECQRDAWRDGHKDVCVEVRDIAAIDYPG
ncbi:hypothetical protein DFJ74DRAFT_649825 [Hyaloraphidium curvatum]|nr:hypothetical protein DFJ74DRAFT_649825 [Hyaloraphidium curvatum]